MLMYTEKPSVKNKMKSSNNINSSTNNKNNADVTNVDYNSNNGDIKDSECDSE
jgi:hypothetical protein